MRLSKDRVKQVVNTDFGQQMLVASDRAQAGNPEEAQVWNLLVDEIVPDPNQPRRHFDEQALQELADDISQRGVLEPILVRRADVGYQIIVGERRWRASKMAGKGRIPCLIRDMADESVREAQLVENILRQDLSDIERGLALRQLYEGMKSQQRDITWEIVAQKVGLSRMRIHHLYSLSSLPQTVIDMIQSRRLSGSHGVELARLGEAYTLQESIARDACRPLGSSAPYRLSVAETRARVNKALNQEQTSTRRIPPRRLAERADEIVSALRPGLPLEIRQILRQRAEEVLRFLDQEDRGSSPPDTPLDRNANEQIVKSTLQSQDENRETAGPTG